MKKSIIILFQIYLCATTYAQNKAVDYQAYISNSQDLWQRSVLTANGNQNKAIAYLGLLNSTLSTRNEELFEEYYDQALELLENLEHDQKHKALAKALLSSIYGYALAYDSWKGIYLGPKSSLLIEEAFELDPDDPIVLKQMGSYKLYTPSMFGGDKVKALEYFEKSTKQFELDDNTLNNWLYLDALVHLGIAQRNTGQIKEAVATFEKVLLIEPTFNWVRKVLLPETEKMVKK